MAIVHHVCSPFTRTSIGFAKPPIPRRDRLHAALAHLNALPSMLADLGSSVEHLTQRITKQREVLVQQRQKSDDARAKVKTCKECKKGIVRQDGGVLDDILGDLPGFADFQG